MTWVVNLYPKESEKFLKKLSDTDKGWIIGELRVLEQHGFSEHNPDLKKMVGLKDVWELKVKSFRIFLMPVGSETVQVLSMIVKKSNKTPLEVVELIKIRAKYFGGEK